MKSIFGDLFDFDSDRNLNSAEQAAELLYLDKMINGTEKADFLEDTFEDSDDEDW